MSDKRLTFDRLQSKVQQYVRAADQVMLEHMRLTVFEVVVGVLRSKDFRGDIPKAVETACKVCAHLMPLDQALCTSQHNCICHANISVLLLATQAPAASTAVSQMSSTKCMLPRLLCSG